MTGRRKEVTGRKTGEVTGRRKCYLSCLRVSEQPELIILGSHKGISPLKKLDEAKSLLHS